MNSPAQRGGPSASLSRIPNSARRVDHRYIRVCDQDVRAGSTAMPLIAAAEVATGLVTAGELRRPDRAG
jgi:hypothetical protein